jgi:hypothetical protein
MTLDSSGNLLVGATTPYTAAFTGISVQGLTSGTGNLSLGLNKAGTPQILSGDVLGNIYFYGVDNDVTAGNNNIGARIASIATTDWTTDGTTSNAALVFYTHGTTSGAPPEAMRLDSSGNLLVGVATANANGGVLQLKSGITFPATAVAATDANTLDDYEEGTWTPVDGSGASLSFTGVSGSYTKVGRCVTAFAEVTYPITASGLNGIIGGLPFTSAAASPGINGYIRYTDVATSVITFVTGGPSSTSVSLLRPGVNTTNVSMSGGTLLFAVIYFV